MLFQELKFKIEWTLHRIEKCANRFKEIRKIQFYKLIYKIQNKFYN
jgi:hypothetical protein